MCGLSQEGRSALVEQACAVGAALSLVRPLLGGKWPRFPVGVHCFATKRMSCAARRGMHDDHRRITLSIGSAPGHQHDVACGWTDALMIIRSGALQI